MNSIIGAVFFGSNYRVAQSINRVIPLKKIYAEARSFNRDINNFCALHGIELCLVKKRGDIETLPVPPGCVGISCGFGVIFQQQQIEAFEYGIWNIHYGKLPEIRGRHPISWGFLRNEHEFGITIHEINTEIDQGFVLAKGIVPRDLNDTQLEVEGKFERLLAEGLIKEAMNNYLAGVKEPLAEGEYYESLAGKFQQVDPEEHDARFLFNLFQSQTVYGGVCVAGRTYFRCEIYNSDFPQHYEGYDLFVCRGGQQVALK